MNPKVSERIVALVQLRTGNHIIFENTLVVAKHVTAEDRNTKHAQSVAQINDLFGSRAGGIEYGAKGI